MGYSNENEIVQAFKKAIQYAEVSIKDSANKVIITQGLNNFRITKKSNRRSGVSSR